MREVTKHTPGPWEMRPDGVVLALSRSERKAIGSFHGYASERRHVEEHPHNCRLIEAAPDLLDALQDLVQQLEATRFPIGADVADSIRVFARPAIAKATGEEVSHAS